MKATTGRIWEAASKDELRPVLTGVYFDAEKATLTATDSYIAARVPCEVEDGDESGLIPAAALKMAAGRSLRIADGKATLALPNGERSWDLIVGLFPKVDEILAAAGRVGNPFGLNADLLRQLSQALGGGGTNYMPVVLHPVSPVRGILVTTHEGEGVIMPVRVHGTAEIRRDDVAADLSDDDVVRAGVLAAMGALQQRRGKRKAAQAFRDAVLAATVERQAA